MRKVMAEKQVEEENAGNSIRRKRQIFYSSFDREIQEVLKSVFREKKKSFYCPFILRGGVPLFCNKHLISAWHSMSVK